MNILRKLRESWGDSDGNAASIIVPRLVAAFKPEKVVDYGCGSGSWVKAFESLGVWTLGFDKNPPEGQEFNRLDFEKETTYEKADLALCLEVAEHLDSDRANVLVEILCRCPVVVFAAGIPLQGGWHHVNEQWPNYWCALFAKHGFVCSDRLRWEFWDNAKIPFWYRQDLLVFAKPETLKRFGFEASIPARVVHPDSWEHIGLMGLWQRLKRSYILKAVTLGTLIATVYAWVVAMIVMNQ